MTFFYDSVKKYLDLTTADIQILKGCGWSTASRGRILTTMSTPPGLSKLPFELNTFFGNL
jgi:hypothetical protein